MADTKGIGTLKRKKKKNGKKGKDKFKNSSDSVIPSSVASATKNVTDNGEEVSYIMFNLILLVIS